MAMTGMIETSKNIASVLSPRKKYIIEAASNNKIIGSDKISHARFSQVVLRITGRTFSP
ncbi:MAG: hypothetical protein ACD_72C00056G0003 [uncultured bacterium]|nr:MAG: hypothetical protein ACD_72C00056G0003 [uncultured bacterium]